MADIEIPKELPDCELLRILVDKASKKRDIIVENLTFNTKAFNQETS
jgi:hypothetical protein